MRYFLISYRTEKHVGTLWFEQEKFPSIESINDTIKIPHSLLAIMNIFEFKSKEDFEDFCGTEEEETMEPLEGDDL